MSEEEMKALVEMNNMLKAKLEQLTKVYQQTLKTLKNTQSEIDDLQRNCDVFNEQMNDAVERATELQIENNKLKQQLQSYKDKEDKLNRIINLINDNAERVDIIMQIAIQEILNEGSDE